MADVSDKIVGQFSSCLANKLGPGAADSSVAATSPPRPPVASSGASSSGVRRYLRDGCRPAAGAAAAAAKPRTAAAGTVTASAPSEASSNGPRRSWRRHRSHPRRGGGDRPAGHRGRAVLKRWPRWCSAARPLRGDPADQGPEALTGLIRTDQRVDRCARPAGRAHHLARSHRGRRYRAGGGTEPGPLTGARWCWPRPAARWPGWMCAAPPPAPGRPTCWTAPVVNRVNAVLLTGGSAYGLAAADGVMQGLESDGVGYPLAPRRSGSSDRARRRGVRPGPRW